MAFQVSPGVEVKEIDVTTSIPALSTSIGAYAGPFRWGPIDRITTVGSETELSKIFGAPISVNTDDAEFIRSFQTAASFLKYGNTLRVARSYDALESSHAYFGDDSTPYGNTIISSEDDLSNSLFSPGIYAKYPGKFGNSLKVIVYTAGNQSELINAESLGYFTYQPGTSAYAESLGLENMNDEVSVAIVDVKGYFSGTPGSLLEVFEGLSFGINAKTEDGSSNYVNDVLNNKSRYIYAKEIEALYTTSNTYILPGMEALNMSGSGTNAIAQLSNGLDGTVTSADVESSLGIFEDSETVDINFLFSHNFLLAASQASVNGKLATIADSRKDILSFISAPLSIATSGDNGSVKTEDVITNVSGIISSYVVFDSTPVQVYNKYTDRYVWIPACGHMAGLCANADAVSDPWFSPGGFTRGQLRGVAKLALNPTKSQRDDLYKGKVNPICSFPGQGIVLYGDKTGLAKPSAFGHINVRRLFITLEKAIATFSKFQLFELNDEFTRAAFRSAVEPYLRNVQARRGISDFRVVCDTTNNTGDIIDSNRFVADIYIKPTYSINYITLNFIATRTGVDFREIVGI